MTRRDLVISIVVSLFWLVVFNLTGSYQTFTGLDGDRRNSVSDQPTVVHHEEEEDIKRRITSGLPVLETPQTVTVANHDDGGARRKETLHVLFGLSGNSPGFLGEFEVSMKSILLNAPLDAPLTIHVMADLKAYKALPEVYNRTEVQTWKTRHPVEIRSYNVQSKILDWASIIEKALGEGPSMKHSIGAFFRLFSHHVVDQDVKRVLYLDTDAVVMANLGELWTHINPETLFAWGANMCSGFVVFNVDKMEEFWNLASNLDYKKIFRNQTIPIDDQQIMQAIHKSYPEKVTLLPPAWDISNANVWKDILRAGGGIMAARPEAGMLHFNGAGGGTDPWYKSHGRITDKENRFVTNWGIALYYARLPWTWARFMAKSQIIGGQEGYQVQVHYTNPAATL